jgi:hypothetical protein
LKNHGLIDDVAASEVADRQDQPCVTAVVAKVDFARIRPSAAVSSLGACPEPAPIEPGDFLQDACHGR